LFVKITNGKIDQYPYTVGDLRRDNPNTSFAKVISESTLASFGVYSVGYEAAPTYDPATHRLRHSDKPVLRDGKWILTKEVVALTDEQIATKNEKVAMENRKKRNDLLSSTDFYALSDVTMSAEMTTYRQALRDITAHANWPNLDEADWPVKP
jgi:hypothetical protein